MSTATQPNYMKFPGLSWNSTELLPEFPVFYRNLGRMKVVWNVDQVVTWEKIIPQMAEQNNICTIVILVHMPENYKAFCGNVVQKRKISY